MGARQVLGLNSNCDYNLGKSKIKIIANEFEAIQIETKVIAD